MERIKSAAEMKRLAENVLQEKREEERKKRSEEDERAKIYRREQIEEVLRLLESTTYDRIKEAATAGLTMCRLQPKDAFMLYGLLQDEAFLPFHKKMRKQGYITRVIQDKHTHRSSSVDDPWDGHTSYIACIEVSW